MNAPQRNEREPTGTFVTGDRFDRFCEELRRDFHQLRDEVRDGFTRGTGRFANLEKDAKELRERADGHSSAIEKYEMDERVRSALDAQRAALGAPRARVLGKAAETVVNVLVLALLAVAFNVVRDIARRSDPAPVAIPSPLHHEP